MTRLPRPLTAPSVEPEPETSWRFTPVKRSVAPPSSLERAPSRTWNAASDPSWVSVGLHAARAGIGPPLGELRTQTTCAELVDARRSDMLKPRRKRRVVIVLSKGRLPDERDPVLAGLEPTSVATTIARGGPATFLDGG